MTKCYEKLVEKIMKNKTINESSHSKSFPICGHERETLSSFLNSEEVFKKKHVREFRIKKRLNF
ncbi:hypothetical protein BpHYR1_032393 [Brachionus plicatilis]|uniref:Uncharacterized protein n=1 Tax=Brachionus plicatilis TaxID=10195 RepID=A0A3M7PJX3_BRAPC|nr:hypothetical protein BpHYR1_032393 [Brachionus plicatilis]